MDEIATELGRSYFYVRSRVLESGIPLRTKADGTRVYITRHLEWSRQFVKYKIPQENVLSQEKVELVTLIATEGYTDATSFGFTNTQELLHANFTGLVRDVYGNVLVGRNNLTSRVSSVEIALELSRMLPSKAFSGEVLDFILASPPLLVRVLRIIANTEGAMIISIKRAKRNFTTESRIVLASSNPIFRRQISKLLDKIGVNHRISEVGVTIGRKSQITRFATLVGFSPGVKVIRKKAGDSLWYRYEKIGLLRLFLKITEKQDGARSSGSRGCFENCKTRDQILRRLRKWYVEANGGDAP